MRDLIFLAAAKFELDPTVHALEVQRVPFKAAFCGIGALNAAKSVHDLVAMCKDKDVIFVGTCGIFADFSGPTLVRAEKVVWLPTCERMGLSYTVSGSTAPFQCPAPLPTFQNLRAMTVLCGPTISLKATLPPEYSASECVENLELYSCASDVAAVARSFSAILCTTNQIGENAHTQWKQNFGKASHMTAEFLVSSLGKT